jgi:formate C-acetyltransferase
VQGIQIANLADSLAVLKAGVYDEKTIDPRALMAALKSDFERDKALQKRLVESFPKYGNDVEWVDAIAAKWVRAFAEKVGRCKNVRGGRYHAGFYTVSAHVPMGKNVAATPDGRCARRPLADGGLSAMAGRDRTGPTALLKSVARIDSRLGSNGALLNMKFLPGYFISEGDRRKFADLLRTFIALKISHVQFNVVDPEQLQAARQQPEEYRGLTVRVAGYTAYFTELAEDLQEEIIARTTYGY